MALARTRTLLMRMSSIGVWSPAIGKDKESGPSYQGLGSAALFNIVQQCSTMVFCSKLFNFVFLCWYSAGTLYNKQRGVITKDSAVSGPKCTHLFTLMMMMMMMRRRR